MSFQTLVADNVLVQWLTGNRRRYDLAVSMAGVKLGERFVQLGCGDGGLLAALGAKVGYTGRACGVDDDASVARRAEQAVESAGVLAEVSASSYARLPYDDEAFDLAVVWRAGALASDPAFGAALDEVRRVLRPGGRCLVVATAPAPGLTGALARARGHAGGPPADGSVDALRAHAFRGAHVLAVRDGYSFVEAMKAR